MAKKKLTVADAENEVVTLETTEVIAELEFADLNTLKDKVNEIIRAINK